ncbi:MAG TPA: TetR/AcrR family transcriptional regulator [Acidimicrobiales bacterium]|nr:TetR/AcrR family transcriptional regulator [Acidimicrobiales bacterium]
MEATDGRVRRRVRNQDAVVDAILGLLDEGLAQPTAQEVSGRSGVSMRSIFRLFDDMEALHRTAIERQIERVTPLLVDLPADGPLAVRIETLVVNRGEVFEAISPVRRLAVRLAPTSPPIRDELQRFGRFFRDQLAAVFATELGDDDEVLLEALDVATCWEAWERLRIGQGLSAENAAEVTTRALTALLA